MEFSKDENNSQQKKDNEKQKTLERKSQDETLNRLMYLMVIIQWKTGMYLGICVNAQIHPDRNHPHWDEEWWRALDLSMPTIF